MFSATNRVDFYEELQDKGSIILVNTSERTLKGEGSTHFGRYIIARTMAAAFERAAIPEQKRRPTFLIVDEAAPYFDSIFEKLLTRVRQYKLGICLAFQHMEQADDNLKSAIASNTSVKLAGGLGYADSRWLARDMETTPEFIKAQHRDQRDPPQWTHLACYVRNYTPSAVSLTVPFYVLDKMEHMTQDEHRALLEANRERVAALALPTPEPIAVQEPPPKPATTTSSPKSAPAPAPTPKPIVPQPITLNTDPDHGEAGEAANKW